MDHSKDPGDYKFPTNNFKGNIFKIRHIIKQLGRCINYASKWLFMHDGPPSLFSGLVRVGMLNNSKIQENLTSFRPNGENYVQTKITSIGL